MTRIVAASVFVHRNELGGTLWMSARRWTTKYAVFVVLEDEDGRHGLGECWCFDIQPDALVAFLRTEVLPAFCGLELEEAPERARTLTAGATLSARHGILASALSGVDIAAWDLTAKAAHVPIWQTMNPRGSGRARLYGSGGLYGTDKDNDALAAEMARMRRKGFDLVKMKVGGLDRDADLARVRAVLAALPDDTRLIIDGVYTFCADTARRFFEALPTDRMEAFQSPVSATDFTGMATLAKAGIPVMGVEAEYRPEFLAALVDAGVAFLQTAPVASGGLTRLQELSELVGATGTRLSLEVSSTAVALMASCHAAAALPTVAHVERHFVHTVFFDHLALTPCGLDTGWFELPPSVGLGLNLNEDNVRFAFQLTGADDAQHSKPTQNTRHVKEEGEYHGV